MGETRVTIAGAGMAGSLLAIFLARRGFEVHVFERRGDLRRDGVDSGRSIKMTLAERGLQALRAIGLDGEVMRFCVPLRGRAVHASDGAVTHQPYGKNRREVIDSVSRADLNRVLLDRAEPARVGASRRALAKSPLHLARRGDRVCGQRRRGRGVAGAPLHPERYHW